MRAAIWVLGGFAAAWGILGIIGIGWPLWAIAGPPAISALLIFLSGRTSFPIRSGQRTGHVRRLILTWTIIEFALIIVIGSALEQYHLNDAVAPTAVIIVGLHFVPLARGIPARAYYGTAIAMIIAGIIALFLAPPASLAVATFGSALILWTTAILLLRKGARAG